MKLKNVCFPTIPVTQEADQILKEIGVASLLENRMDRVPVMRARPDASYNAQWSPDWVYNYVQTPCHLYGS